MKDIFLVHLSPKQKETFDFMQEFSDKHKKAPTLAQMAQHFNVSIPTVHHHVQAMKAKGAFIEINYCPTCGHKISEP